MLRSPELIEDGVELVRRGGYIDCTVGCTPEEMEEGAAQIADLLNREGVSADHVTMSTDAFGSQPKFNEIGECIGLT